MAFLVNIDLLREYYSHLSLQQTKGEEDQKSAEWARQDCHQDRYSREESGLQDWRPDEMMTRIWSSRLSGFWMHIARPTQNFKSKYHAHRWLSRRQTGWSTPQERSWRTFTSRQCSLSLSQVMFSIFKSVDVLSIKNWSSFMSQIHYSDSRAGRSLSATLSLSLTRSLLETQ